MKKHSMIYVMYGTRDPQIVLCVSICSTYYPTLQEGFYWNLKHTISLIIANSPNLNSAYYQIYSYLPNVAYIISGIQKQKSLVFIDPSNQTILSRVTNFNSVNIFILRHTACVKGGVTAIPTKTHIEPVLDYWTHTHTAQLEYSSN